MSSSQGVAGPTGYQFTNSVLRDSSDWTRLSRERLVYRADAVTAVRGPEPIWIVKSNNYRLSLISGRAKCSNACQGGAYN